MTRRRVSVEPATLSWQAVTVGIVTWRRQRPVWMTSGMFEPTGMFVIWKWPEVSVAALTSGEPLTLAEQVSHATPGANAVTVPFGT